MTTQDIEQTFINPVQGATKLIFPASEQLQSLTNTRETDARTAMTRGVKEYLEQLSIVALGGREVRFTEVLDTYAEPERPAQYPSACVYAVGEGTYEASQFTQIEADLPSGIAIFKTAELSIDLSVELWATDPKMRMALVAMLEDAFDPADGMSGFVLELPHYYNVRAVFEKRTLAYEDIAENDQRRWRKATFTVNGTIPQIRSLNARLPRLRLRTETTVVDPSPDIG